jgi:hypothetical protein
VLNEIFVHFILSKRKQREFSTGDALKIAIGILCAKLLTSYYLDA